VILYTYTEALFVQAGRKHQHLFPARGCVKFPTPEIKTTIKELFYVYSSRNNYQGKSSSRGNYYLCAISFSLTSYYTTIHIIIQ
jgi:hypothetical protein